MRRPGVAGGDEGLLGARQVALAQPDGAELDKRPPELPAHPGSQLVTGTERLGLGGVARSGDPQHLGPVDPAPAVDAAERRTMTPVLHDLGPLVRQIEAPESLRRADQLAV